MKLALKYGLLITAVLMLWVVIVRFIVGIGPESKLNLAGPILFNLAAIAAIFLGMQERKRQLGGEMGFKEGIKTGVSISFVYAVSACLFFLIQQLVFGPELLLSEAGPNPGPLWQVAAFAYAGLFLGSLLFGLIYATIISFFLARRQGREQSEII